MSDLVCQASIDKKQLNELMVLFDKNISLMIAGLGRMTNTLRDVSEDQLIFYSPKSIPLCLSEMPGLKLPLRSDLLDKQFRCQSSQSLCWERLSHLVSRAFYSAGSKDGAQRPLFLGRSRCARPTIFISFVRVGMYVSCSEMLERFQTKLGKNINKLMFFP